MSLSSQARAIIFFHPHSIDNSFLVDFRLPFREDMAELDAKPARVDRGDLHAEVHMPVSMPTAHGPGGRPSKKQSRGDSASK